MALSPLGGVAAGTAGGTDIYAIMGISVLMLVWPLATILYIGRLKFPRRGVSPDPRPLSSYRARRLHLRTRRITL